MIPAIRAAISSDLVSIITPAFNAASYIEQTIESVLSQTYKDWEMLIVDDCSPDKTVELVRHYAESDDRVHLIRHERNAGPAQARESALRASRGRYVAFLDSDDTWHPQKLSRQVEFMRRNDAAFSFTAFHRVSADGSRKGRTVGVPPRMKYAELLKNTAIATSTVIIDREKIGAIKMKKTYYDDYALWLEITKRGFVAAGLPEDLMEYRVTGGSVSRNKLRSARMVWRLYRDVEKLGRTYSAWCLAHYGLKALRKYSRF